MLTFLPGEKTRAISLLVRGDRAREGKEAFAVILAESTNAALGDHVGRITIRKDD